MSFVDIFAWIMLGVPSASRVVHQRHAEGDQRQADLDAANRSLDRTTARAAADGYVTNLAPLTVPAAEPVT